MSSKSLKRTAWLLVAAGVALTGSVSWAAAPDRVLWFASPAERFTESCPLGNGRLGAMVFGGVRDERIVLNEAGMWSGSPQDADRPNAAQSLPEIRRLLLAGENQAAQALANRTFTCAGAGSGRGSGKSVPYGSYQVLGDLHLAMQHAAGPVANYRRELRLGDALATVTYQVDGVRFKREAFVSAPDEAIVVRFTADTPGAISFDAWLERPERARFESHDDALEMHGQLEDGRQGNEGVRYSARVLGRVTGGESIIEDNKLRVRGADQVVLLVTAATDIRSFAGRGITDARRAAEDDITQAAGRSYAQLRERQAEDHRRWYDRASLRIDDGGDGAARPLAERLDPVDPADAELVATLFDYGRYLLVSSSREGGFPANLQGIWAEGVQTPWNGDWHANVNIQMNYWPAEPTGLGKLHQPLFALVDSLVEPGSQTAKAYYNARGWVAHLLLNPWGFTSPGESARWGSTPTCSAWMCQHLWDHYLYSGDTDYLAEVYPTLRGSAEFYADMLIEEPEHGWLVTAPSNSPENAFLDDDGNVTHICMGPAMDQQLLRYLFNAVIQSARVLGKDNPLIAELNEKLPRLAPTQIAPDGRVMEWLNDRKEEDPRHRHVSHLWGLYPGDEIQRETTPELAEAARRSLDARGDDGTGWAIAYKACLWARLGDGDHALKLLRRLLRPTGAGSDRWDGGVYPNLLVAHPPFQIDGNFGATAAIAEMLVQSRYAVPDGESPVEIELLPALPTEWRSGEAKGLRARGGVTIDLAWEEGKPTAVTLTGNWAPSARVRCGDDVFEVQLTPGVPTRLPLD